MTEARFALYTYCAVCNVYVLIIVVFLLLCFVGQFLFLY